jgi:hypothetical protein
MSADKIIVSVIGSNPEAVEAVSHSVAAGLQNDGFHNTTVISTDTGEPEAANTTLLELLRKGNPEIFNVNIQVQPQFDAPEADMLGASSEVETEDNPTEETEQSVS